MQVSILIGKGSDNYSFSSCHGQLINIIIIAARGIRIIIMMRPAVALLWKLCWLEYQCQRRSLFLSVCLSIFLPIYLSICLSIYVSVCRSFLSIYLSIYPSIHVSSLRPIVHLINPSIYLSIYQSIYLFFFGESIHLSIYLWKVNRYS